ncbi:MAG TPA: purine-nucleoside phosphorylase [Geminicoccaceae bacterium]|nr:purine-nucleoside phosphorylase [Geminicoccaceae bacterium]
MRDLLDAALAAYGNAHAPYSQFQVGAAVRTESGRIFAGANVENAAYPEGNCAEASALAAMVAAGERRIVEVLVVAGGERLCTPCGGCRQRLSEFGAPATLVHLCDPGGLRRTVTLGELLPLSFSLGESAAELAPRTAIDVIQSAAPDFEPRLGLVLGSGLGALADALEAPVSLAYADLPGFPRPTVEGHGGRLLLGRLEGVPVACLQGRAHLYEGVPAGAVNVPMRTLKALGCEILVLTNAAGSLRPEIGAGTIVLIADHINLLGQNPLVGANDAAIGPRFPDLSEVYDAGLRAQLARIAEKLGIELPSGVYVAVLGPSFETPAEIRALRTLGADLVGMSTVPEAISARHAGLRVVGLSVVTNLAAGLAAEPLSHAETLAQASTAAAKLAGLLRAFCREIAHA